MKTTEAPKKFPSKKKEKVEQQNQFEDSKTKPRYGSSVYVHHNFDDPYGKFH